MSNPKTSLRWGVEQRLEFIEFRLFWDGGINRSEIKDFFGVSVPQASNDLAKYIELAPNNMEYDRSEKRYFATQKFKPIFLTPDAEAYLAQSVDSGGKGSQEPVGLMSQAPLTDMIPLPHRQVDASILRSILAAIRDGQSIEIKYQSMNQQRPEPVWRRISPHAFGSDGLRWHVRAFCHIDSHFKDFLLSRCLGARNQEGTTSRSSDDDAWNSLFEVILTPNPKLSEHQRNVIAWDFGMPDHKLKIPVRQALLYYFEKRLRLDVADLLDTPQETPIIIHNRVEFDKVKSEAK